MAVKMEGTKEEAKEILEAALEMEVEEEGNGEEMVGGTLRALVSIENLTQ